MQFVGVKIPDELATLINEEVKRSDKSKSDIMRDALNQYFNVDIPDGSTIIVMDKNGLIELIDSRVGVKPEVKPEDAKVLKSEEPLIRAKRYILSELKAGREPTVQEVAEAVGMESRSLGRIMKEEGIQAVKCHRDGVQARRYTFELREKIEEMPESKTG